MTERQVVLRETRDGVQTLKLNRPDKLNALDFALTEGLVQALKDADADPSIRVVIVTGAGRGFCAGADTREFQVLTPDNQALVERRAALTTELQGLVKQMSSSKPPDAPTRWVFFRSWPTDARGRWATPPAW